MVGRGCDSQGQIVVQRVSGSNVEVSRAVSSLSFGAGTRLGSSRLKRERRGFDTVSCILGDLLSKMS